MLAGRNRLKEIDEALASGKIALDKYEMQKADVLMKLIAEYHAKLEDKAGNFMRKSRNWRGLQRIRRKLVLLYSHFVTTRLISRHRKLQRKFRYLEQTNGLNDRIDLSPNSTPRLFVR